ncbi:MAG: SCO family protein [Cyclobacteriaceae bacterium]
MPHYGRHDVKENTVNGELKTDTVFYSIPDFTFLDQDSNRISQADLSEFIYVSDFFFTTCPSICPIMAQKLLVVHEKFKDNPKIKIVSHTLDPEYDLPFRLREYADNLGVSNSNWLFLWTSNKDYVYKIAETYYVAAVEDENTAGGINHSGKLVLVDKKGTIRGFYEGTKDYGIEKLIKDIPVLLEEE